MALTKPTLLSIAAFDATQAHTFQFTVVGGAQPVANTLVIRNNATNAVVYQSTISTYRFEHTVPGGTLQNGVYYNVTVQTKDSSGNLSPVSTPLQFWCYTTPVVSFTNIVDNGTIDNASYAFTFEYAQAQGEALNSYILNLYNSAQQLVSSSGVLYPESTVLPYDGAYMFSGFEDKSIYSIELIATTVNDTVVSTGRIHFTSQYKRPDIFTLMELSNNCAEGYILIKSNINYIEGTPNPDPPIYLGDKEVDLTGAGAFIDWKQGYTISGDMLARLWFRNPNYFSPIITFSNISGDTITISIMKGYESAATQTMQVYAQCQVTVNGEEQYFIISNYIDELSDSEYYCLWLTRENNIYKLEIQPVA